MLRDGATAAGAGGWYKVTFEGEFNGLKGGMMLLGEYLLEDVGEVVQHCFGLEVKFTITVPGDLVYCSVYLKMLVLVVMAPVCCISRVVLEVFGGGEVVWVGAS